MSNALTEVSYRQVGSANRVQIVINRSTVTIDGQGGYRRQSFARSYATPPVLWKQLRQLTAGFGQGELASLVQRSTDRERGDVRAMIVFQYGEEREQTVPFAEGEMPEKLRPLFDCLIDAWSPLEEVVYSESGMSERLHLDIRRDRTEMKSERGMPGKVDVSFVTPADYWEEMIEAVSQIDLAGLKAIEAPSNRRAADISLYAALRIRLAGAWYDSGSFDDDNPPVQLKALLELIKQSEKESFRQGR